MDKQESASCPACNLNSNLGPDDEIGEYSLEKTIYCYKFSQDPEDKISIDTANVVSEYLT